MIRELLNRLDYIVEARGIGARRPGDAFVSTTDENDTAEMESVSFYPQDRTEVSIQGLNKLYTKVANDLIADGVALVSVKPSFSNNSKSFGVAVLKRSMGQRIAFIKPFNDIKGNPEDYAWDNQTGLDGYKFASKSAKKNTMKIQASDILTTFNNLTPDDIYQQILAWRGGNRNDPLARITAHIVSGAALPATFEPATDIPFEAFRDFFLELLQPVALMNGQSQWSGSATGLNGGDFTGYNISFNTSKNSTLSDSLLVSDTKPEIRVSSKAGVGAFAAASNILKVSKEIKKLTKVQKKVVDMIERMVEAGQWEAPLVIGMELGIIDSKDAESIRNLRKKAPMAIKDLRGATTANVTKLLLGDRLKGKDENLKVNMFTTATAGVAYAVANAVNKTSEFSDAACDILNHGMLVQVYTHATESGGKWKINKFDAKYPSTEATKVKLNASKNYLTTQCKGNFCFEIEKNGNPASITDADEGQAKKAAASAALDAEIDDTIDTMASGRSSMDGSDVAALRKGGDRKKKPSYDGGYRKK